MRNWLAHVIERLAIAMDDSIPASTVHSYLRKHIDTVIPASLDAQILIDQARIHAAFLLDNPFSEFTGEELLRDLLPVQEACTDWLENRRGERMVRWKGVQRGTSEHMLALFLDEDDALADEVYAWLQALLRHVEVRRKAALYLLPDGDADPERIEQSQTAYLFSRAAIRWRDARFLNAALKLNDWSFPTFRSGPRTVAGCWYVLALAGTEHTLEQMTC